MDFNGWVVLALGGLASASSLFLVACGLSLIFGVTRIVNFAHGSFFMLGIYLANSLVEHVARPLGMGLSYWAMLGVAALISGLLGGLVEMALLRRIYKAPELFQLLATFALVLVMKDAALWAWGPEDVLGPRAPGFSGAIDILGRRFPSYDLLLIGVGPLVLALLWLVLSKTRFGVLLRAATQDREMVGALGVHQAWLFTGVFALGCTLAGLGGALQLPREAANLGMDMLTIGDAFVIVVVGGMGSIPGAYAAALMIGEIKALCIGIGTFEWGGLTFAFSKLTLVAEFLVMAVVLLVRPWGLMGRPQSPTRATGLPEAPLRLGGNASTWAWMVCVVVLLALPQLSVHSPYTVVLAIDMLTAALFACSLHFIMGPAGMHSFGHAAYFGLGAYTAAVLSLRAQMPMVLALAVAPLLTGLAAGMLGWFCVRLSGVYLAMLTLALAQILWSICFQWDGFTGGSNGLSGVWPAAWAADKPTYYYICLVLTLVSVYLIRRMLFAPFGYALRASRDSSLRAEALGMNVKRLQWLAFMLASLFAGLAGALFVFSKGSISPDTLGITKSVDGLVMVLLGGVQMVVGPLVGALSFIGLQDTIARSTDYWRAVLGGTMLVLVLGAPQGLAGFAKEVWLAAKVRWSAH